MAACLQKRVGDQKGWLNSAVFDEGVALCQAIPGATAIQVTAYTGLRIRRAAGALARAQA